VTLGEPLFTGADDAINEKRIKNVIKDIETKVTE
jgi:hypothetical protein